jgi:hypothetical protein
VGLVVGFAVLAVGGLVASLLASGTPSPSHDPIASGANVAGAAGAGGVDSTTAGPTGTGGVKSTAVGPPGAGSPSASKSKPAPNSTQPNVNVVRIWPIGDSITAGAQADQRNGYRLYLWNALAAAGYSIDYVGDYTYGLPPLPDMDTNGDGGACILANPCNPSDILFDVTNQSMARLNPDIVIMNGGANDFCCGNSQDPARVEGYMQRWIQLMWTIRPNAQLIVLGLTADYHVDYDNWTQQYVAQLKAQGKRIDYVFIEDVTTSDTVHPDNPGYQTIANRITPKILPMLRTLTGR